MSHGRPAAPFLFASKRAMRFLTFCTSLGVILLRLADVIPAAPRRRCALHVSLAGSTNWPVRVTLRKKLAVWSALVISFLDRSIWPTASREFKRHCMGRRLAYRIAVDGSRWTAPPGNRSRRLCCDISTPFISLLIPYAYKANVAGLLFQTRYPHLSDTTQVLPDLIEKGTVLVVLLEARRNSGYIAEERGRVWVGRNTGEAARGDKLE